MKHIVYAVFLWFFSVNALAELTTQEQQLVDMMKSGELKELKVASQQMVQSSVSNVEVLDIGAEILLRKYKYAYAYEIDTLAWLAKSLGASNNSRYYSVLSTVANEANDRKLASHARKAIKSLKASSTDQYQQGQVTLPDEVYPVKTKQDLNNELMAMILSGSLSDLKNAAKKIILSENQSQAVSDTAAEVLLSLYPKGLDYQADTLAWVAKALAQNKTGRYHDVLSEVASSSQKKIEKHAKKALKAHGKAKGEQYKKGMTRVEAQNYI